MTDERQPVTARRHDPNDHDCQGGVRGDLYPLNASPAASGDVLDWEAMRIERGWPTPNGMRRAAEALDHLTPAKYGDILRWIADACDARLSDSRET